MSVIQQMFQVCDANRAFTLATLDTIEKLPNPQEALGWRPGPVRAHAAWQLMHIGVTEELFATERITGAAAGFAELIPRFRGGSVPDDHIPGVAEIRDVLNRSREHLKQTFASFGDEDLATIPEPLRERGWSLGRVLEVLAWHEPHHQGQAHITLNLWKATQK